MTDLRAFQSVEAWTPCSRWMYARAMAAEIPSGHTSICPGMLGVGRGTGHPPADKPSRVCDNR